MRELDTDPAVHRYLGGIGGPRPASLADSEATIRFIQAQYAEKGIGRWAVTLHASGEFMGWAHQWAARFLRPRLPFHSALLGAGLRLRGRAGLAAGWLYYP